MLRLRSMQIVLGGSLAQAAFAKKELTWKQARLHDYVNYTFVVFAAAFLAALLWRLYSLVVRHLRRRGRGAISNEPASSPGPSALGSGFKKHALYAPLFRKRKARDMVVGASGRINLGALPTRLEAVLVLTYFIINMVFIFVDIDYTAEKGVILYAIRNRSGAILTANLAPLFLFAFRNNPLIRILDLSFDNFNLLHRWLGRIATADLLIHVFSYIGGAYAKGQQNQLIMKFTTKELYIWSLVAGCPMLLMVLLAWSPIRRAFYDMFLQTHRLLAIVTIIGTWKHISAGDYYEIDIVIAVVAIWAAERITRVARLIYRNMGKIPSTAVVEILPGDTMRVTVQLARPWTFTPGQHAYIYMPAVSLISSHPFSAAWSGTYDTDPSLQDSHRSKAGENATAITSGELTPHTTTISFLARVREGFTRSLWDRVSKEAKDGSSPVLNTVCFLEGPYSASSNDLTSYGTAVLFAGGVGITHELPLARHLVADAGVAGRRVLLLWAIRAPSHAAWAADWIARVLALPGARDVLRVHVYVSDPEYEGEGGRMVLPGVVEEGEVVRVFEGRTAPGEVLDLELAQHRGGAVGVSVCGPGGLSDDVRFAVRERQHKATIDYIEESFSW